MQGYDDRTGLVAAFRYGFTIQFYGPQSSSLSTNHASALNNVDIVDAMLSKELRKGRIAGPFPSPPLKHFRVSPLGLVPKKKPGKFRLIHNLSSPDETSVNAFIPLEEAHVSYETLDTVDNLVQKFGPNSLIAKADIEEAFRRIRLHHQTTIY